MSEKVRFGMIGCGEIAVESAKGLAENAAGEIVAAMDPVQDVASDLARRFGGRVTTRVEDVIGDARVEAVIISTPHFLHAPLTIQAAGAGKHVLVEKPIACDLKQADAMLAACAQAGVLLGVLLPLRFEPSVQEAKRLLAAGAIGTLMGLQIRILAEKPATYWRGGYSGRVKTDWRLSKEKSGGGVLSINCTHDLDALLHATGLVFKRAYAEYDNFSTPDAEVEDLISVNLRFAGGEIGWLQAGSSIRGREGDADRLYGTRGQMAFSHIFAGPLRVFVTEPFEALKVNAWNEIAQPKVNTRALVIERFAKAVRGEGPVPVTGLEARQALEIVRAAYLSQERGHPVEAPVQE
jgi:UDP-N-acetyl-2-amino-2-deoxyglucuronate dehydrogenase